MGKVKELSYFCPAYNEEENLEEHVRRVLPVLKDLAETYELLIVNNGSTDKTPEIAERLCKEHKGVRVIHHESNRDYGGALTTGFTNCKYDLIAYTDSDLQYDFGEVKDMLPFFPEYDVVIGNRHNRKDNLYRKFQSKVFNGLTKFMFGLKVKDINCSFKAIKKKFVDGMNITSRSSFIDAEILIKALNQGATIREVNITHYHRTAGAATGHRPMVIFITLQEMFGALFSKR